jgi:hypothetical protein
MKFQQFDIENQIYVLKFLGNVYLNLKLSDNKKLAEQKISLKTKILANVVKYDLRVFKNIMIL